MRELGVTGNLRLGGPPDPAGAIGSEREIDLAGGLGYNAACRGDGELRATVCL